MLEIIGRFHPVILHLPIGIFSFVFLLELLSRLTQEDSYQKAISIGILSGALFALFSSATGLLLVENGDYEGDTVDFHKWSGLVFTSLSILLYFLHRQSIKGRFSKVYLFSFLLLMGIMVITGHKGGSITHGDGFLTNGSEKNEIVLENIDEALVFDKVISPIFKNKCNSCHNPDKAKGKLVMTSPEALKKGGKNGKVIIAGDAMESNLLKRVHLPIEEKKHMPPKSKKQLTSDEVVLIEWWINEGASFEKVIGNIERSEQIDAILRKYAQPKSDVALNVKPAKKNTLESLNREGIAVNSLSLESPLVEVNLSYRKDLNRSILNRLKKVDEQITYLNLGYSNVNDQMLSPLKKLPHVKNLQLQKTDITSQGLKNISGFNHLEILNLYGTQVNDQILDVLLTLKSLKSIYLWDTEVTDSLVTALQKEKPLLDINFKIEKDLFGDASLKPPLIVTEKDLFSDSLTVELRQNFKNTTIYYTTDGSDPDSTSLVYLEPIKITKTSKIKCRTAKDGWGISDIAEKLFVRSEYEIASITLAEPPSSKYLANGAKTLTDFEKGNTEFASGKWTGFEQSDLVATMDLGRNEKISSVTVSALESTGAWIFHPVGMTIWTSTDGKTYEKKKSTIYPVVQVSQPPSTKNFMEKIDPTEARYVKVEVKRNPKNPPWHPNPGGQSWLFVDEIIIN